MRSLKILFISFMASMVMLFSYQAPAYAKGHLVDPTTSTPSEDTQGAAGNPSGDSGSSAKSGKAAQKSAESSIASLSDAIANVISGIGIVALVYSVMKMFLSMLSDNPERLVQGVIGVVVSILAMTLPQFVKTLF